MILKLVDVTKISVILLSISMGVSSCARVVSSTDGNTKTASVEKSLKKKSSDKKTTLKGNKQAEAKAKAKAKEAAKLKAKKDQNRKIKPVNTSLAQLPSTIQVTGNPKVTRTGEVYLLRGLANVFSRGMDTIGVKMARKGFDARVYNHASWRDLADNIIARNKKKQVSYPIIIMGHSLGANASMIMAKYLGDRGIKVSYVVGFDPTIPTAVGKNVNRVVNFYLPNEKNSNKVLKANGFKGNLKNVNMRGVRGNTHLNIEKDTKTQKAVIDRALSYTKKRRRKKS